MITRSKAESVVSEYDYPTKKNANDRQRVSYIHDEQVGNYYYAFNHPMKPHRLALTYELVLSYGLHNYMNIYSPVPAKMSDLCQYHTREYIEYIKKITDSMGHHTESNIFGIHSESDCPPFPGMYDFFATYSGASLQGVRQLNSGSTDIAINWSGGLHHARKEVASGFCFVNDIVLSIIELLRFNPLVIYIDIDIHHGDGVQYAFYHTNRVLTVSFHLWARDFFPWTGKLTDTGSGEGKYYSVNVPLKEGITDQDYTWVFKQVMTEAMARFQPSVIVLQCGADSLAGDHLGRFNLSIKGHGACVEFMKTFKLPMLVLGGGGYTIENVARCWTYETSVLVGQEISQDIPNNTYYDYYADGNYKLHCPVKVSNPKPSTYIKGIVTKVRENLRHIQGPPSVSLQEIPSSPWKSDNNDIDADEEFMDDSDLDMDESKDNTSIVNNEEKQNVPTLFPIMNV